MASILRSGKFIRYFAGITRNVVVQTARENESGNFLHSTPSISVQLQHGFASAANAPKSDVNLDKQLRRLDQDVRRIGRISRRDIEEILEEIRTQRSATSSQSLLMIRCCGNLVPEEMPEVRTALVQEIWKTLSSLNVPMDISHYNALLRVYLENEHPFSPTDFLAEIEAKGIEANRVTYQRLIARYCQQGDIEGATRILEYMRGKNLPVNENVFNSLILGHSQANDMESAKGILGVMKQAGLDPSADTYTTMLCCYARHGDIETILSTLEECEKKEMFLLDKDLLDIVYTLSINGHGDKTDAVLAKLHKTTGFNQDAVNVILRLTSKGYEDVGLKILRVMPRSSRADGQLVDTGSFFIRQLVKMNRPIEKILDICKTLQSEGLNPKALLIATEAGLINGAVSNALPLLHEMKNAGLPIRQHYFWPLFCSVESNEIIDIVRRMQEDFSLNPNSETIRDYVIPNLKEKNWDRIVTLLRDVGVPNGTAASAAAYSAVASNQLKEAANIMESYKAYYPITQFKQQLIEALHKTNNYGAFIRCVRQIYESNKNRTPQQKPAAASSTEQETVEVSETESVENVGEADAAAKRIPDVVGAIAVDCCTYFRRDRIEMLEKLLPALEAQGLSISSENATRISDRLGEEMTTRISELLGKLSAGDLEPVPLKNAESRKRTLDSLTVEEMERFISNVQSKGDNANNLKRQLLNACFRSKNLTKTLEVIERLEAEQFAISSGIWAQLIDLYVHHGKSEEALSLYEKMKTKEANFQLDNLKTMHVLDLLIKEERFDDAFKMLEGNKKTEPYAEGEGAFNYIATVWRVLNQLAETGNVDKLQKLFDTLVESNYILPTNVVLGPLIKVHLVKDDIPSAMQTFEVLCDKYKATPWKNELARRLIQNEDAANLQKLTDLSTNIHGEVNSLYDLVFSFVECGRIRQARKILETPGLRTRPQRITNACERYKNEGMVEPLEGLVEATRDLNHIDRNKIYYNLLLSYSKGNEAEKALGLWTKMQDEGIAPTDAFLQKLSELLKKNNMDVPFVVTNIEDAPNVKQVKKTKKPATENTTTTTTAAATKAAAVAATTESQKVAKTPVTKPLSKLSLFRKAVKSSDLDAAIMHKNDLSADEKPGIIDMSHLIELLVRADRLSEATKYVEELLATQMHPLPKIFKFYMNKMASAGDVDKLKQIGVALTDEQKRLVSFDNRYCHAVIVAGKAEQYFKQMNEEVDAVKTPEEAAKLADKFPRGGAVGLLEKHPELVKSYEELAVKYAKFNQLGPMNVLWMHLISQGNDTESKVIWDKYLSSAPRLMFQRVLQTARDQNDEKMAQIVIGQLRESKISEGAIGNAYSCLIDIHTKKGNEDKALDTLKTAIKDVCLENINRTALLRLKSALEEQKKEFPYTIPERKTKNDMSSSSSTSDEDVRPQTPETRPKKPETK